jgi:demethylmenaquinone methyltransferase/2-methoxy-6-polyprenyl-1,4-benzoquinol methylase|tara:strand:- start:348 stop:1100 length:753 start_codon:yes stop_codon:yes gene_type:complete
MAQEENTTHFGLKTVDVAQKVEYVRRVFNAVVDEYDLMNDLMSLGVHRAMKNFTVEMSGARQGHRILDLAGGTGDIARRLSPLVGGEGQVVLCDINESMLAAGRDKLINQGLAGNLLYVQADAEELPFPDGYFDCITIGFGLRNFSRIEKALRTMLNVLKPGGRLLVLEFSTPRHDVTKKVYDLYSTLWPKVGKWVTKDADSYRYLVESIRMHPDQETLEEMLVEAGYTDCLYHNLMDGIVAIHRGVKPW